MQEFKRMQAEEEERKKREAENTSGWTDKDKSTDQVITELDASKLKSEIYEPKSNCDTESP